jgi:FAD:protein FMN transferase
MPKQIAALLFLIISLMFPSLVQSQWYYQKEQHMGTEINLALWHEKPDVAEEAIKATMKEMARIDQLMSPYIASSELSVLNRYAFKRPVAVSLELYQLIQKAIEFGELTHGAFDITFASVGFQYDYRKQIKPSKESIKHALASIDYRLIKLLANNLIQFESSAVKIDLGGIAKGHAVDNAIEKLKQLGIKHASISAGGDTRLLGDRHGAPWIVGIKDPRRADDVAVKMPLADVAISTSGDYERYFIDSDGKRFHHIINPKTGDSAREVQSVTIIADNATTADALSTSIFILGVEQGLNLINAIEGISAIIIDNHRKMHYSKDLQGH